MKKIIDVSALRHGEAFYGQGEVSLLEANDLTPAGQEDVEEETMEIIKTFNFNNEIKILICSSLFGRALHSVKIIFRVLSKFGFSSDIIITKKLGEIENFDWRLFQPLIKGGNVNFNGESFFINKKETNPKKLTYPDYYINNAISNINPEISSKLPVEYIDRVKLIEIYKSASNRMIQFLLDTERIVRFYSYNTLIVVTHDGLLLNLHSLCTGLEPTSVEPGKSFGFKMYGDQILTKPFHKTLKLLK